ncbi:unnamed protein product [Tuber aestivum]|uniref:BTB domain-containing protein n=1 Tax=Tuber aestivum TaxID=59557 RepID=A0A292Q9M7_9PEZI|nr:unnamed protein product [Tuber aestivum]
MPVAPKRNNGQDQSLTALLRNIISEYPAGGGVLRGLCQNADDAGADAIEFVLDTRQYPTENLLHEDLADFQGISLLAYNNKPFTQKDFESLIRIGDSGKTEGLTSTRRFGRGFNSVYHWTDNPSILSGTSLLLLDPHKTWSSKISFPGGPLYDFVDNHDKPEMKNQLSAFGAILRSHDAAFDGTIIRLPLRSEAQAIRSGIVEDHLSTSRKDIEDIFELFANELEESLLFLRNLRSITLRIDDTIFAKARSTVPNETKNAAGENPVNEGYRQVFVEQSREHYESDFMMEISILRSTEPGTDPSETKVRYAISHYLRESAGDGNLQKWARNHRLFPWVAIANPLDKTPGFGGRLFTTLPLPIQTKHPAHIHGIFSITPDRSNIHSGGDTTMSSNSATRLGAQWNEWLLHECVPHAWVRNLEFMRNENLSPGWDFWPAGKQGEWGQLWMGILGTVFKRVVEDGLELLPTLSGMVKPAKEVAFTLDIPEDLHSSLRDAGARVVFPPADRGTEIGALDHKQMGLEYLSPSTARRHLTTIKDSDALLNLDIKSRTVLLDYVLSDCGVQDFKSCEAPLIPLSDGTFRGLEMATSQDDRIFIARDRIEEDLFTKSPERIVKIGALPKKSRAILVRHIAEIEKCTRIKAWTVGDAAQYCSSYEFDGMEESKPVVKIDKPGFNSFVELFWEWASKAQHRGAGGSTLVNALKDLWLIPLGRQMFQRIGSISEYPVLNVSASKGIGSFLKQTESALANRFMPEKMHLYTGAGYLHVTQILQGLGIIKDYDDRASLMKWLEVTMKVFAEKLDRNEKMELIRHLFDLTRDCCASERCCMEPTVRKLPIFQAASYSSPNERAWITIARDDSNPLTTYVGVGDLSIALDTPQHVFIDTRYHELKGLVSHLQLFKCPSISEVLEDHVVPRISETGTPNDKRRIELIEFALSHFEFLSAEACSVLSTKEIVPVSSQKFRRPQDTVSGKYVAALYFEGEERSPTKSFDSAYHSALVCLGMSEGVTDQIILERIHSYSRSGRSPRDINDKVSTLFQSKPPTQPLSKECMELCWIPAISLEGELGLFSAGQCRPASFRPLCNYSMPVMKLRISQAWENWLGWDGKLTVELMKKQLEGAIRKDDRPSLASLAEYWCKTHPPGERDSTGKELKLNIRKWIPGSSGGLFSPTEIFFTGATQLSPYYDNVCERFLEAEPSIKQFLTHMGVKQAPAFEQLKELQDRIAAEGPLSAQALEVALYIVAQVAKRHTRKKRQNLILDLKAPDQDGFMRTFRELTTGYSDIPISLENRPTLHPRIPESTIRGLGLPTVEDRILASFNDPCFEQDFSQTQSPKAVIRDTLQRYSVESTFSEYLANAEDCMDEEGKTATRIDWMIDHSTEYPTEKLITQELEAVQGKALFCYNDGVFTDEDFKSIIDVGIGSKGLDYSKIGKFGEGALTISLTHTNNQSPENCFLPPRPLTGKPRGGLKLRIRDVQAHCPDQLKPFEGVFGFSAASPRFEGTIFRFPFRGLADKSVLSLRNITPIETCSYLDNYKEKARISLLFLKHVSSISYWQKGLLEPIWTVSASSKPLRTIGSTRINEVEITVKSLGLVQVPGPLGSAENDKWWTIEGSTEEQHIPAELVEMAEYNRLEATYGLAVPNRAQATCCFMGLPLQMKYPLSLPVSINANMALQSDRQTPISEEKNGPHEGLGWNNWIFREGIVPLYLLFLRHLMKLHGTSGYRFWPAPPSELKNPDHISLTISTKFWKKAGESSFDLHPRVPPSLFTPRRIKLQTTENLSIKKAIFNFLSAEQNQFIVPLLMQLGIMNMVIPSLTVAKGLIEATSEKVPILMVTPAYVRDLLRNPAQCKLLQDHWEKDPGSRASNINKLLSFLLQDTSDDCLTGCSLLPLHDGSWGTFSPRSTSQIQYLTSITSLERSILEVEGGRLVSQDLERPVIEGLSKKEINISLLSFDHIAQLCRLVESKDPQYRRTWLANVWEYFEQCVIKDPANKDRYLKSIESLPALSNLILPYISDLLGGNHSLVDTLKRLPIWPVLSGPFQPAVDLKLAPHTSLALTTIIDQTTFLKPELASRYRDELKKLGVSRLSYLDFLKNEVGLTRGYLPAKNIGEYRRFIEIVHKVNPNIFQSYNLAVNGDYRFCLPSTLYDSSVPLLEAAFRDQRSSRFLHPELAGLDVWSDFLIKNVSRAIYMECTGSIWRRNNHKNPDDQIKSDSRVVFGRSPWSIWRGLRKMRFVPVQEATALPDQSKLRGQHRVKFWQRNKRTATSEAVDPKHERISWGQKLVRWREMGSLAFRRITSVKPTITPKTMIGHLEFLAAHREEITEQELPTRISEIKKAYRYLEKKIPTYTIQQSAPIWLNVENEDLGTMTLETFRKSWLCSTDLCLDVNYDPGKAKHVRSFLDRFRRLLLHANVSAIILPPSVPEPPTMKSPIPLGILNLREQELLSDITITAPLRTFKAHKIVLASVSDYWRAMFTESSAAEVSLQDDPGTINVLLDYIYTNTFIKPSYEENVTSQLENLLDQLEKSEKWLLPSFKHSMEHFLSDAHWIRPETVKSILRRSEMCNANQLACFCKKYIENNRAVVEREAPEEE